MEWLERMDIPIEETTEITRFQEYLKAEFGIVEPSRVEALWGATRTATTLAEAGIRQVTIQYPWGRETRYGVAGMPGLWGWESVRTIMAEEGWW